MVPKRRGQIKSRIQTNKIIGRLTYTPEKHKQKFIKAQRTKLASRPPAKPLNPSPTTPSLTFGSLNVNGLDMEAHWAVTELLKSHNLDVSINSEKDKDKINCKHALLGDVPF